MKKIFSILILALSVLLFSCDVAKKKNEFDDIPQNVIASLKITAQKNFPSNEDLANNWIERQVQAYKKLSEYIPAIPASDYSRILKYAKEVEGDNYVAVYSFATEMVKAYEDLVSRLSVMSAEDIAFVKSLFEDTNAIEFKIAVKKASDWIDVINDLQHAKGKFSDTDFKAIKQQLMQKYKHAPQQVLDVFYAQIRAQEKVKAFYLREADAKKLEALKAQLSEKYPQDFIRQIDELEHCNIALLLPDEQEEVVDPVQKANKQLAEKIFRNCVFTKYSETGQVSLAILVKMRGRTAVICSKEFIPRKMPVYFGSSVGHIKCSSAYVSEKHPLIILFPDKEPMSFAPLEIASETELNAESQLYMVSPLKNGFEGATVKLTSKDSNFFKFEKTENAKSASRLKDINDFSFVVDSKTGKLVSVALRYVDYGIADAKGNSKNIFTGANVKIPSFAKFAKNLDAGEAYLNGSSLRFVRMSALKDWQKFDTLVLLRQKDFVRKYSEVNKDFFEFFTKNSFSVALRSARLSSVAAKYRRSFEGEKLSADAFNTRYTAFVKDMLKSMASDIHRFSGFNVASGNLYSVYQNEIAYQVAFRVAMYNYLTQYFEENSIDRYIKTGLTIKEIE